MADEPRGLPVPQARPGTAQNVGVATPLIPGRLIGGKAIRVTPGGLSFSVDLDISKLAPADPGILAQQWFAMWREGDAPSDIFRVPMTVIPSLPLPMNQVDGLVAALAAIDADFTVVDAALVSLDGRLDTIEPIVATHTSQIETINSKLADGDRGDITTTASFGTWTIDPKVVTDAKLRDSAGLTVIGRSANSSGSPSDIAAGTDGHVLFRNGAALGFGQLVTLSLGDNIVTDAKLRDSAGLSVIGRSANSLGDPADIAAGTDGFVLRRSGTSLGFGTIATAGITDDAVTNAKLANVATATFKGRTTAGTGDPEDLTATQATALLSALVGDSGSGGTKGLVPAPAAGDAAASKVLGAGGGWVLQSVQSGAAIGSARVENATYSSTTSVVPLDDTIPQITEGTEILSVAYTPKASTSTILLEVLVPFSLSALGQIGVAVFDGSANALASSVIGVAAASLQNSVISVRVPAGSTSPRTYSVRAGPSAAGTVYFNGTSGGRLYGGSLRASLNLTEIAA